MVGKFAVKMEIVLWLDSGLGGFPFFVFCGLQLHFMSALLQWLSGAYFSFKKIKYCYRSCRFSPFFLAKAVAVGGGGVRAKGDAKDLTFPKTCLHSPHLTNLRLYSQISYQKCKIP